MKTFNSIYPIVLMTAIFVFYPINHLFGSIDIPTIQAMAIIMPLVLIGVIHMILAYRDTIYLLFYKIPIFTLFAVSGTAMIVLESYIFQSATYVPGDTLTAYNIYWFVFIISGMLFAFYLDHILDTIKNNIVLLFVVSSLWFVILAVFSTHFSFFDFLARTFLTQETNIDFQTLSDYTAMGAFILIAKYFKNNKVLIAIIFGILIEIFLIGSRSSILVFVVAVLLLLIRQGKLVFLLSVFSVVLILFAAFFQDILSYYANDYRIMSMLGGNYEEDLSLKERTLQLHHNLKYVNDTWVMGRIYGEYLVDGPGTYIHNYLAYLQNFGIVPFAILNILMLKLLYSLIKFISDSFEYRYIFLITVFAIISMIISRSYGAMWTLLALSMSESYFFMLKEGEFDEEDTFE